MPNRILFGTFIQLLEASSSFKLLSPEQQAEIRANYENASDEQLQEAIKALEEDKAATTKLEEEREQNKAKLEERMMDVKTTLRSIERDERVEAEQEAKVTDEKTQADLLNQIDQIEQPKTEAPKKRKKFLGIF